MTAPERIAPQAMINLILRFKSSPIGISAPIQALSSRYVDEAKISDVFTFLGILCADYAELLAQIFPEEIEEGAECDTGPLGTEDGITLPNHAENPILHSQPTPDIPIAEESEPAEDGRMYR